MALITKPAPVNKKNRRMRTAQPEPGRRYRDQHGLGFVTIETNDGKQKSRRGSTKKPIDNYPYTQGYNQRYFQQLDARILKLEQSVERLRIEISQVRHSFPRIG